RGDWVGAGVGRRVHRDGLDAHPLGGSSHSNRDLPAVGDQKLPYHFRPRCPFSHSAQSPQVFIWSATPLFSRTLVMSARDCRGPRRDGELAMPETVTAAIAAFIRASRKSTLS